MDGQPARMASKAWLRALERSAAARKLPDASLAGIVQQRAAEHPDAPALLSDGVCWSYAELVAHAKAFSDWALAQGLQPGDAVCLLMANSPQYVAAWLGIGRVGGVVALLNTNLVGEALLHCARAAAPRHVIADRHHAGQLAMLTQGLPGSDRLANAAGYRGRAGPAAAARHACNGAADLHLGHHGAAESGPGQPCPAARVESLVCRHDGCDGAGPHV